MSAGLRIYLVSRSPRRRELLKQIGVAFDPLLLREGSGRAPDMDEAPLAGESPEDYVMRVCTLKAETGWERVMQRGVPRQPVLSADTTVCVDETILGKPASPADAVRMLGLLSAREHRVLTAVAIRSESRLETALSASAVRFRALTDAEIRAYVDTGEPNDKAGAYAIQGRAAVFVAELRGSYSGVMGLPLYETAQLLERFRQGGA